MSAKNGHMEASIQRMAFGFKRTVFADIMKLADMKGPDRTIVDHLDGGAQLIRGALTTGQPGLVELFYDAVLAGVSGGYGGHDGGNLPPCSTLRYAAFRLSIISDWLDILLRKIRN